MKKTAYFSSVFIFLFFVLALMNGCDSPTNTKATSVTAPSLSEPADNSTGIALTPHFKWTGTADKLEYATNSNFSNGIRIDVSGSEHTLTGSLSPNTVYFWKAGKTNGSTIVWSETYWRFTTGN